VVVVVMPVVHVLGRRVAEGCAVVVDDPEL
jgi:hypothetical protein